ncbi:MAG: protein-L-isoaspartate O-methyltransferase [Patescibacteria group bacterium]
MDKLIAELLREGALRNPLVLSAFTDVDRADFVLPKYRAEAYQNYPLPIGYGQTISQPYTVAFMMDLLDPKPGHKILEAGSGCGWQTAMLAHIVGPKGHVYAMEIIPELAAFGEKNAAKYPDLARRIAFIDRSAENGLPEHAPFDRIIAAASLTEIPEAWNEQLAIGGKMVFPLRESIYVLTKRSAAEFDKEVFPGFVFVPFVKR